MRGLAFLLLASTALAQQDRPRQASVTPAQQNAIRTILVQRLDQDKWCDKDQAEDLLSGLTYEDVPLSDHPVILVSPAASCARGGQGANSALWLFDFIAGKPRLLGSPVDGLQGWWNNIGPHISHAFHDVTVGWHMSATEYTSTTLRFTGNSYKVIHSERVFVKQQ